MKTIECALLLSGLWFTLYVANAAPLWSMIRDPALANYTEADLRNEVHQGDATTYELGTPKYEILSNEKPEIITADHPEYLEQLRKYGGMDSSQQVEDELANVQKQLHVIKYKQKRRKISSKTKQKLQQQRETFYNRPSKIEEQPKVKFIFLKSKKLGRRMLSQELVSPPSAAQPQTERQHVTNLESQLCAPTEHGWTVWQHQQKRK